MKKYLLLSIGLSALFGCYKSPDTSQLSVNFIVKTTKQPDANFTTYKTFYISDTIALKTTNPKDTLWFGADARTLIAAVRQNMVARGYTDLGTNRKADLGLGMTAVKDLNLGVVYPGWWWGYWGGCYWGYCGYPPYYPWYPSGGIVYSIPTGTLILDMIDLKNAQGNGKLYVPWGAVMSGGLGYTNNDLQLGVQSINQAYTQSEYIRASN